MPANAATQLLHLYIDALPIRGTSPYVMLEEWIAPALAKITTRPYTHYTDIPGGQWRGRLAAEVSRMVSELKEPLHLVCDSRAYPAQLVFETLKPLAAVIVRGMAT